MVDRWAGFKTLLTSLTKENFILQNSLSFESLLSIKIIIEYISAMQCDLTSNKLILNNVSEKSTFF